MPLRNENQHHYHSFSNISLDERPCLDIDGEPHASKVAGDQEGYHEGAVIIIVGYVQDRLSKPKIDCLHGKKLDQRDEPSKMGASVSKGKSLKSYSSVCASACVCLLFF